MDFVTSIIFVVCPLCVASMIYTHFKDRHRQGRRQGRKQEIDMDTEKTDISQEELHNRRTLTTMAIIEGILNDMQCMPQMGEKWSSSI